MSVLLCDLSSVLAPASLAQVHHALAVANGGITVERPEQLLDQAFDEFAAGRLGEPEFIRLQRARLGWRGSDPELLSFLADACGTVDVAVMELLVELRDRGWHLVGILEHDAGDLLHQPHWGGRFAEQLAVFDRVHRVGADRLGTPGQPVVPRPGGGWTDPRRFAELLRAVPTGHGERLYVDSRPEGVAAARRSGLDAHLFRGASGLRATCLQMMVSA